MANKYINKGVSPEDDDYIDFEGIVRDTVGEEAFDQFKYVNKYNKEHYKRVTVMVPQDDAELIEWLNIHKPYSGYILGLIEADMKKHSK